jgi:hypothetical protein
MTRTEMKLIRSAHRIVDAAIDELLKAKHATKMCRCEIRKRFINIVMTVRQPFWSGGNKKSRVFEIVMRVTGVIRKAPGVRERINKVLRFDRLVNFQPVYGHNPIL